MNKIFDPKGLQRLDEKLGRLNAQECQTIMFNAIRHAAGVLKSNVQTSLTIKMGFKATTPMKGRKYSLSDGIRMRHDKTLCQSKVYITGFAIWFESGTTLRKTAKGYNRGQVSGLNYFALSRISSEEQINNTIVSSVEKQLERYK